MRTAPLGELTRVVSGTTPPTDDPNNWDGDVVWITPVDLGQISDPVIKTSARLITRAAQTGSRLELVPPGSVVMSSRAPIGHIGIAGVELCTNQGARASFPARMWTASTCTSSSSTGWTRSARLEPARHSRKYLSRRLSDSPWPSLRSTNSVTQLLGWLRSSELSAPSRSRSSSNAWRLGSFG